jgi:hypothetical protein
MEQLTGEKRRRVLRLIERAFDQALKSKGPAAQTMTVAVLNNRLLELTNRTFKASDFGATSLRELLGALAPEIQVSGHHNSQLVRLHQREADDGAFAPGTDDSEAPPALIASDGGRIRADLWNALMDYASRRRYVWDERRRIAREATPEDQGLPFPTLRPDELDRGRSEFVSNHQGVLSTADATLASRWRDQRLPTFSLPLSLQQDWNRELTRRARQRLNAFFAALAESAIERAALAEAIGAAEELDQVVAEARDRGDLFAVGELIARHFKDIKDDYRGRAIAQMVIAWSGGKTSIPDAISLEEVTAQLESLPSDDAGTALVNAVVRLRKDGIPTLDHAPDLAFKLKDAISQVYEVDSRRSPLDTCNAAAAKLESKVSELEIAVNRFLRTTPATAKAASIAVLRAAHALNPLLVSAERGYIRDLEVLVGPAFRKFCEAYERNDDVQVLRRAPEFLENIKAHSAPAADPRVYSSIWNATVAPIMVHLSELIEEALSRGEVALAPVLELRNGTTKADLSGADRDLFLSFALRNSGRGHAHDISLLTEGDERPIQFELVEPVGPFDIPPGGEQLVRVRVHISTDVDEISARITWLCQTPLGKEARFDDQIVVTQQVTEPNWEALVVDPPYSLNPIRVPERLYGRGTVLQTLKLAAMSGASQFVWGQKRIGKTSLLQVLAAQLEERPDTVCILFRMGELAPLHEGEMGSLIRAAPGRSCEVADRDSA